MDSKIYFVCLDTNNNPLNVEIKYDVYGNLYFDSSKLNISSIFCHQICVDNKNGLYLESDGIAINNNDQVLLIDKIELYNDSLLKKKIIDEQNNDTLLYEDNEYILNKKDDDEEEYDEWNDSYGDSVIDEDNVNLYGKDNIKFDFMQSGLKKCFVGIKEDIMALYDSYIYDNDSIIFCGKSQNNSSIYRINIKKDKIIFRPIGFSEKIYRLVINNEKIFQLVLDE